MKRFSLLTALVTVLTLTQTSLAPVQAQINTDKVMAIGCNALYFEDYVLSIQYFNQVINAKPHLAEPYFFRAAAKLYLEDYKGAEEDCSKALGLNAFLVRAYLCRSYARMSLENYKGAVEDCQKGLEFEQDNKVLMQNRALSELYDKDYTNAQVSLKELIKRYPNYVYSYMIRGQLNIERGDTMAAIEDYSRAISIDKDFAPARAGRAYVYLTHNDFANALPDLDEAIRLNPDIPGYYINRGLARYNLNNLRGTLDDFDRVIRLDPNNVLAWFNRGLIRSQVGDLNRAIEDLDKVIYLDPDNHTAIYNRALLRNETGDYRGAISDLNTIVKEYPKFTPALYQRSDIKRKAGDAKGADRDYFTAWGLDDKLKAERRDHRLHPEKYARTDSLREASRDKKRDMDHYNKLVYAKNEENSVSQYQNPMRGRVQDQAVEMQMEDLFTLSFYENARPGPNRNVMDYSRYINNLINSGQTNYQKLLVTNREKSLTSEEASYHFNSINELSSKIEQTPGSPTLYFARGLDYALVQDINNALENLDKAIEAKPDFVLAYFERANLRYRKINVEYAENQNESETATMAAKVVATSPLTARSKKGSSLEGISFGEKTFGMDYELVIRDYEKVLSLDPKFIYAWFNRGNIRCLQRDYRNALIDFGKAIELNPDFAEAWFNRGITQIYLGDRAHGISDLRMAGQLGLYKAYNLIKRFEDKTMD